MKKIAFILLNVCALGLVGCSSSGSSGTGGTTTASTATAGETTGTTGGTAGTTTGTTTGATAGETTGATSGETTGTTTGATTGDTTGGTTGGTAGANPGIVPNPVIGELTSLDVSTADSVRGYKIYAGNEKRTFFEFPGWEDLVEDEYFNLSFPCTGDGFYEAFIAPQFAALGVADITGNFSWGSGADASDADGEFRMTGTAVLTGQQTGDDEDHLIGTDFEIETVVNGSVIVGTSVLRQLVVARIVQFEECS